MPLPRSKTLAANMLALERKQRSRLQKLLSSGEGLIRGTPTIRERTCGKSNCRCARGEKHSSLYLVVSLEGKYKQVCVPRAMEGEVQAWVAQYQRMQALIEEISKMYLEKLTSREK